MSKLTSFAIRRGLAIAALATICSSCTVAVPHKSEAVLYEWHDDGGPGEIAVHIDISRQIATYTRNGRPVGWSYVATGKEGHSTSTGSYAIMEKLEEKYSNRYGWVEDELGNVTNGDATPGTRVPAGQHYVPAPMPFWMRVTSYGIGMHAGVIPRPGETASHGCIRLPKDFAPILFEVTRVGTPVTITRGSSIAKKPPAVPNPSA